MKLLKPKRWSGSKTLTLLVALLVVLGIGVSGTLAYLFVLSDLLNNTFQPVTVTSQVIESTNGAAKTNVQIQNTGKIYAWMRVTLVATWEDAVGNAVNQTVKSEDLTVDFSDSGWLTGADGYYYCINKVAPNGLTPTLLDSVSLNTPSDKGYCLNYQIICEAIQAEPDEAVEEAWKAVTVTGDNLVLKAGG